MAGPFYSPVLLSSRLSAFQRPTGCANRAVCSPPAMKSKLSTIASVHVYSVQKALLKDSSPLYNTDYDIVKTNLQHCSK